MHLCMRVCGRAQMSLIRDFVRVYVAWHRYLAAAQAEETIPAFQELGEQLVVDEASVRTRIQEEKAKEAQRPGAKRYI